MGISTTFKVGAALPVLVLLVVLFHIPSTFSHSHRCEHGQQYLEHELQRCVNCTRCNATEGLITLQPCELHRDTVCGPVSKLLSVFHIRHQTHRQHHAHHQHHGVAEDERPRHGAQDETTELQDTQPAPFNNVETIVWDWQAIALTMAVFTCLLFFLIITLYSMYQARQWRRLKENFDADVEELSVRLSLMAANSQEKGEVLEPNFGPIQDPKKLQNRCMYLEQLIQVRKEKNPNADAGNVYIEETPTSKPTT